MSGYEEKVSDICFIKPDHLSWNLENDLHVWKFPVIKADISFLTASEKEKADRFRFEDDRNRYSVGRKNLRLLLSKYLSVKPADIIIYQENSRKPSAIHPISDIQFNISHSGDWVLIALANAAIGIDIEKINPDFRFDDLLQEHFSESEQLFISQAKNPVSAFYFLWTRKEALTKARGTGLQENLKMVTASEVNMYAGSPEKPWKTDSFQIETGYPAAIAYSEAIKNIIYFDGGLA